MASHPSGPPPETFSINQKDSPPSKRACKQPGKPPRQSVQKTDAITQSQLHLWRSKAAPLVKNPKGPLKAPSRRKSSSKYCRDFPSSLYCDSVCVAAGGELCIWNPSTRKSKRLPTYAGDMLYGFGYDESNDDYKVVGFFQKEFDAGGVELEVKVYTLRTASWRRIEGFSHCRPNYSGIYLNGALHWIAHRESNGTAVIVSIDLAKETHGEILEPDYRDGFLHRGWLDVLNGYLCILCSYRDYADVWVMNEYGTKESWTKLVVIPFGKHPLDCPYLSTPVCILKNGEVLLYDYMHLVWYNPKDGTFSYPVIDNCSARFSVYPYIESIVSLDIDAHSGV